MTLIIELTPEMEERLRQQAARQGQPADEYARIALETVLTTGEGGRAQAPAQRSPEELLALARERGIGPARSFQDLLGPEDVGEAFDVDAFLAARREWQREESDEPVGG